MQNIKIDIIFHLQVKDAEEAAMTDAGESISSQVCIFYYNILEQLNI